MIIVFAEKPYVGRELAPVLGATKNIGNALQGNGYTVLWAAGHLFDLQYPDEMKEEWKPWDITILPMIPTDWPLKPVGTKFHRDLWHVIKASFTAKDTEYIVVATDAGREGELIFRYCYAMSSSTKPWKRLWLQSLTPEAIKDAFAKLRDGHAYDGLAHAAECRARADWMVNLNCTRAYTALNRTPHGGSVLSVGRVQTPTLSLLCAREDAIDHFVPDHYHEVVAVFEAEKGTYKGTWIDPNATDPAQKTRILDPTVAASKARNCVGCPATVLSCQATPKRESPPKLPDLGELQRLCNRRLGLTAKQTLDVAQELYEQHHAISYPRSSSRYLPSDMLPKIWDILHELVGGREYAKDTLTAIDRFDAAGRTLPKAYCDDSKVTDHHAIIPTGTVHGQLTGHAEKVFDLVCRRFLAVFYPDYEYDSQQILTEVASQSGKELFRSTGSAIRATGWKALLADPAPGGKAAEKTDEEDDQEPDHSAPSLPALTEGQRVRTTKAEALQRQTKPPRRHNDATLIQAMETAGRNLADEDLAEAMKECGIGTPATRAAVIETLLERGYLTRKRKDLVPTELGRALIAGVVAELKTPALTGEWEARLARIEKATEQPDGFMRDISAFTRDLIARIAAQGPTIRHAPDINDPARAAADAANAQGPLGKCPACAEGQIRARPGFYGCDKYSKNGGCRFTIPATLLTAKISPADCRKLLSGEETAQLSMFSKEKNRLFTARLKLGPDHRIVFLFGTTPGGAL